MLAVVLLAFIAVILPAAAYQLVGRYGYRRAWQRIAAATLAGGLPGALFLGPKPHSVDRPAPWLAALDRAPEGFLWGAAFGFATGFLLYLLYLLRRR